jgi:hypothetical protein
VGILQKMVPERKINRTLKLKSNGIVALETYAPKVKMVENRNNLLHRICKSSLPEKPAQILKIKEKGKAFRR